MSFSNRAPSTFFGNNKDNFFVSSQIMKTVSFLKNALARVSLKIIKIGSFLNRDRSSRLEPVHFRFPCSCQLRALDPGQATVVLDF